MPLRKMQCGCFSLCFGSDGKKTSGYVRVNSVVSSENARAMPKAAAQAEAASSSLVTCSPSHSECETFELAVKGFAGNVIAMFPANASTTILEVKLHISKCCDIKTHRMRILSGHRILVDEETLDGIVPPNELTLVRLQWKTTEETYDIGDLVQLHHDGRVVLDSLNAIEHEWFDSINDMLGRTFRIKAVPGPNLVSLPFPEYARSMDTITFPDSVVRDGEVLAQGDIVKMLDDREAVRLSFQTVGFVWANLMVGMLGKEFPILEMTEKGIIALPSPDGSQGGKWYFPVSVVRKVTGEHEEVVKVSREMVEQRMES